MISLYISAFSAHYGMLIIILAQLVLSQFHFKVSRSTDSSPEAKGTIWGQKEEVKQLLTFSRRFLSRPASHKEGDDLASFLGRFRIDRAIDQGKRTTGCRARGLRTPELIPRFSPDLDYKLFSGL